MLTSGLCIRVKLASPDAASEAVSPHGTTATV
jgi:hypothetical protein